MTTEQPDPPRRPLRVRLAGKYQALDGTTVPTEGSVILHPDDPAYEAEYQQARATMQQHGTPMPYADEETDADEAGKGAHG